MSNHCPECGTELSPDTATIRDGDTELKIDDAYAMLAGSENSMRSVVLECECGWSVFRTVTVRTA